MPAWRRHQRPDGYAPDGAEIRNLIHRAQGAAGLSLAEALVPPGARTAKVYHQTVYEEIWYITAGSGEMHLHAPAAETEEVFPVERGDAVLIPPGHGFWVGASGAEPLIFLCIGAPPWPGDAEAQPWPPPERDAGA
jgi:mannose-6-phosphate isomerase-like protein (cupin superfamily)